MSMQQVISKDVLDIRDGTHDSPKYKDSGYPLITSKNLKQGKIDFSDVSLISEEDYVAINKRSKVDKGDILYSMIGSIGNYALVDEKPDYAIKNVALFKFTDERLYNRYFLHLINSFVIKSQIERAMIGGTQKFVSLKILRNLKIPLPPLPQQKRIAAILDAADAYRQKTKTLIAKYNELTQSLFLDMFGDPQSIKSDDKLGSFCDFFMGGTPAADNQEFYNNGNIDWLKGSDISKEYIYSAYYKITGLGFSSCNTKTYPEGTIVIGRTGQGKTRGKVGMLMKEMCTNETMIAIVSSDFLNPYYLLHNLKNRYKELRSLGGDNQRGGITQTQLKILPISVPSIEIQNQFAERVQVIEAQKEKAQASLAQAENLFNSLLQRAFKGELTS